jgi:hypothetical protein
MSKDLTKQPGSITPKQQKPVATDPASRLKRSLMEDALGRMFGKDAEKPVAPGTPRVMLTCANHEHSPGWEYAKALQRQLFDAAVGVGLQMKFAFFGPDNAAGVRRFKITTHWIGNPDEMAGLMDRAACTCGCYVLVRSALEQAVKQNKDRPMRAVIVIGDVFHDDQDSLDEAALAAVQLHRAGTKLFFAGQGNNPTTARKLQYLARVSGGVYFPFDPKTQERQFAEMWSALAIYVAGGEEAVKASGAPAGTLLLEHLRQQPMPIMEAREQVRVKRGT